MSRSSALRAVLVVSLVALFVAVGPSAPAQDTTSLSGSPRLVAACNAWREHVSELLDQHRIAHEIGDDALFGFVRQFIAARNACSPDRYEIGLRMYEAIPLGRVQQRHLN